MFLDHRGGRTITQSGYNHGVPLCGAVLHIRFPVWLLSQRSLSLQRCEGSVACPPCQVMCLEMGERALQHHLRADSDPVPGSEGMSLGKADGWMPAFFRAQVI